MINSKPSIIIGACIAFCMGALTIYNTHKQNQINANTLKLEKKIADTKNKKQEALLKKQAEIFKKAKKSTNSNEVNAADQVTGTNELKAAATKFFSVVTTYRTQKQWDSRQSKIQNLVTPDVIKNNKGLFNSGLDSTGGSIIEALKLESMFRDAKFETTVKNENKITGIAHITYESNKGSEASGYRTQDYLVKYDTSAKKITSITDLGKEMVSASMSGDSTGGLE